MKYRLRHESTYRYSNPISDSVMEMRVHPVANDCQKIEERNCLVNPQVPLFSFEDYFGNQVEYFSVANPHDRLTIVNEAVVETSVPKFNEALLNVSFAEYLQLIANREFPFYYFRNFSKFAPAVSLAELKGLDEPQQSQTIGEVVLNLNSWIHRTFQYQAGATDVYTPLSEVIMKGKGVCQDFSHLMLSILRRWQIPCRYVSGYIEGSEDGAQEGHLVGALASHAWVEVYVGGDVWLGLDPTNNCQVSEQHIKVAHGRDYLDVSPVRGTFRGIGKQSLTVKVDLLRV